MKIQMTPQTAIVISIFLGIILVYGLYLTFVADATEGYFAKLRKNLRKDSENDKLFYGTGLDIKASQFTAVLLGVCTFVVLLGVLFLVKKGNIVAFVTTLLVAIMLYVCLIPREKLFDRYTSPFMALMKALTKSRRQKLDNEIYQSCITLKNLAIVQREMPLSGDRMIEKLAVDAKDMRPIYEKTLSLYRTGEYDAAFEYFRYSVGTQMGSQFASLLSKLDRVNPEELIEQIIAMEEATSEKRLTLGFKKAERNGVISMACATACSMLVLLDFAYIVILLDMMQMITGII